MHKQKDRSIITSAISIVIALILVILLIYIVFSNINGQVPNILGYSMLRIISPSMEDTIPTGTYILVRKTTIDKINEGDIVTFYSIDPNIMGALNTHRVIEINDLDNGRVLKTKGDANVIADNYLVDGEHLYGRYVCSLTIITIVGNLFMKRGMLIVLLTAQLALGVSFAVSTFKYINSKNKEDVNKEDIDQQNDSENK